MTNLFNTAASDWGSITTTGTATSGASGTWTNVPTFHTPPAGVAWLQKPGDHYFETPVYAHEFTVKRAQLTSQNQVNRPGPTWTEEDEHRLVDKLWRDRFDEPWPGLNTWSHDDLDLDALPSLNLRKYPLQPFKIAYQSYAEIKLRLYNTVISIKGHPFLVKAITQTPAGWKLAVSDGSKAYQVQYNDLQDLRSIPPMYITANATGWLCRHPGRVYQQGINRNNTSIRSVDCEANLANLDSGAFLVGFRKRVVRRWLPEYGGLMEGGDLSVMRLSDDVAVQYKRNKIVACYRGRALGHVTEDSILAFDEDDVQQGWIETAVKAVGLELKA